MTESKIKGREKRAQNHGADSEFASAPQFISIGHFAHDVTEHGLILGGAAAYSSIAAKGLSQQTGVISAVGEDFLHRSQLDGIPLAFVGAINGTPPPGSSTTTFTNIYENGVRRQLVRGVSAQICPNHIPLEWQSAEIVYLCPIANEIHPDVVHKFPNSLIGASPQGWMRQWDAKGQVSQCKWKDAPKVLPHVDVVVMSEEDIAPFPEIVEEYAELADIVVLTRGERGSTLFRDGKKYDFAAFSTKTVDPTGAGDVFATAFLTNFVKSRDIYEASTFANCTASFVVEAEGTKGIPDLGSVCSRMKMHLGGSGSRTKEKK